METAELKWHTANGDRIPLNKLDHQHISNIIWYYELLFNINHKIMRKLLNERFNGHLLNFKPLPIKDEIISLYQKGFITPNGDIIKRIGLNKMALIGSITHIPNWQELLKIN